MELKNIILKEYSHKYLLKLIILNKISNIFQKNGKKSKTLLKIINNNMWLITQWDYIILYSLSFQLIKKTLRGTQQLYPFPLSIKQQISRFFILLKLYTKQPKIKNRQKTYNWNLQLLLQNQGTLISAYKQLLNTALKSRFQ